MSDEQSSSQNPTGPGCLSQLAVGAVGLVLLGLAGTVVWPHAAAWIEDRRDQDGDGVANMDDHCPTVAGAADFQYRGTPEPGCPDPDPDDDKFFVNIPGGMSLRLDDTNTDKCPDKKGDVGYLGCPAPTAEELAAKAAADALTDFDKWVTQCWSPTYAGWHYYCKEGQARLEALAALEQTDERKAKVVEADQLYLVWQIGAGDADPYEIPEIEKKLARVTSDMERKRLRIGIDKELWVYYYVHCNQVSGLCDPKSTEEGAARMGRAAAYSKISAFLPFEQAYPKSEELVAAVRGSYPQRALYVAKEQGLTEDVVRTVFELEAEDFELSDDCDKAGKFYREAGRYGWFRAEAERCAQMYLGNKQYKTGVVFARAAGLDTWVVKYEQAYVQDSLDRGEYTPNENGVRVPAPLEDHEDWQGTLK